MRGVHWGATESKLFEIELVQGYSPEPALELAPLAIPRALGGEEMVLSRTSICMVIFIVQASRPPW